MTAFWVNLFKHRRYLTFGIFYPSFSFLFCAIIPSVPLYFIIHNCRSYSQYINRSSHAKYRGWNGSNVKMHFLPVLGLMSDSLMTISVELHQCPSHQLILLTQGPISLNFAKKYWELMVFKNVVFLSRPFWIFFFKKKCCC